MKQQPREPEDVDNNSGKAPGFMAVMFSVVAAAFGVQNRANRERDFAQGSFLPYIVGGIVFTVIFVFVLLLLVRSILGA